MVKVEVILDEDKQADWSRLDSLITKKFKRNHELSGLDLQGIMEKYEKFIYQKAGHFENYAKSVGSLLETEDIASFGREGLVRAIERYNPKFRVKFLTYAGEYVKWHMQRGIDNSTYLRASGRDKSRKVKKAIEKLKIRGVENPTLETLAQEMKIDCQGVKDLLDSFGPKLVSLDYVSADDDEGNLFARTISSTDSTDNVERTIEHKGYFGLIPKAIEVANLSEREGIILKKHFMEGASFRQIGRELGISGHMVGQTFEKMITKIRLRKNELGIQHYAGSIN